MIYADRSAGSLRTWLNFPGRPFPCRTLREVEVVRVDDPEGNDPEIFLISAVNDRSALGLDGLAKEFEGFMDDAWGDPGDPDGPRVIPFPGTGPRKG